VAGFLAMFPIQIAATLITLRLFSVEFEATGEFRDILHPADSQIDDDAVPISLPERSPVALKLWELSKDINQPPTLEGYALQFGIVIMTYLWCGALPVPCCTLYFRDSTPRERVRQKFHDCGSRKIDTSTGKLMEGVLAAFAQFDNDCRSDRTRAGMKAALELGRWVFLAPLGYINAPRAIGKSLMADPERAPFVRQAFEDYATGRYTKERLLKQTRASGLTNRRGRSLTSQAIGMLLRNRLYAGIVDVPEYGVRASLGGYAMDPQVYGSKCRFAKARPEPDFR
jgi:hypothetical protein